MEEVIEVLEIEVPDIEEIQMQNVTETETQETLVRNIVLLLALPGSPQERLTIQVPENWTSDSIMRLLGQWLEQHNYLTELGIHGMQICKNLDPRNDFDYEIKFHLHLDVTVNPVNTELETPVEESDMIVDLVSPDDKPRSGKTLSTKKSTSDKSSIIAVYPVIPVKGCISINEEDFKCLRKEQFLNDVIIDFYIKYLMEDVLSPNDKERTYAFSSHFYTRLENGTTWCANSSLQDKELAAQKRHLGVQRWTKNVNIFEKDFIIIPVNKSLHWFLVIICFPYLVGYVDSSMGDCYFKSDEARRPCILILDSIMSTTKRNRTISILREYLVCEYRAQMHSENDFSSEVLPMIQVQVPQQLNLSDCGLYVLQYVESFFKKPIKDFSLPFKNLSEWFDDDVIVRKRSEIAQLIKKLANEYNKTQNTNGSAVSSIMSSNSPASSYEDLNEKYVKNPLANSSIKSIAQSAAEGPFVKFDKLKTTPLFDNQSRKFKKNQYDNLAPARSITQIPLPSIQPTLPKTALLYDKRNDKCEKKPLLKTLPTQTAESPWHVKSKPEPKRESPVYVEEVKVKTDDKWSLFNKSYRIPKKTTIINRLSVAEKLLQSKQSKAPDSPRYDPLSFEALVHDSQQLRLSYKTFKKLAKEKKELEQ